MPELIPGGVDIPIKLREELEEGKVIFFCGAGVSIPSGLPTFKGLIDQRPTWHSDYLKGVLDVIAQADPSVKSTQRYKDLRNITGA